MVTDGCHTYCGDHFSRYMCLICAPEPNTILCQLSFKNKNKNTKTQNETKKLNCCQQLQKACY